MARLRPVVSLLGILVVLVAGCAGAPPTPSSGPSAGDGASTTSAPKALTIGIHSDGLITADTNVRRPVGRLAEQVPTVENGGVSLLPDGRMRVAFTLRKGVTWHHGAPFTAQDLAFTYQFAGPDGVPHPFTKSIRRMSSVEAPDDHTFVVYYPALSCRRLPRHPRVLAAPSPHPPTSLRSLRKHEER